MIVVETALAHLDSIVPQRRFHPRVIVDHGILGRQVRDRVIALPGVRNHRGDPVGETAGTAPTR